MYKKTAQKSNFFYQMFISDFNLLSSGEICILSLVTFIVVRQYFLQNIWKCIDLNDDLQIQIIKFKCHCLFFEI